MTAGPVGRVLRFAGDALREMGRGSWRYWAWVGVLGAMIAVGVWSYGQQLNEGLVVTNMSNQVSWGFYIANFTFLVGVAAAAVMLVIPAYIYNWKPIKEIAIFGELLAVSAIVMSMLFVFVDVGRPDTVSVAVTPASTSPASCSVRCPARTITLSCSNVSKPWILKVRKSQSVSVARWPP